MMKEKAFIHCFSTNNNYYVYDVNTNSILRINKEIYIKLNEHTDIETLLDENIVYMRVILRELFFRLHKIVILDVDIVFIQGAM